MILLLNSLFLNLINCFKIIKHINLTTSIIATDHIHYYKKSPLEVTTTPNEEKLLRYLFKDYNPNIMPKENMNESFKLYFGLAMAQLINIVNN